MEKYIDVVLYHSDRALHYSERDEDILCYKHLKAIQILKNNGRDAYEYYCLDNNITSLDR